jgi:hypothetical protein
VLATMSDILMPGLYAWENDISKWRDYTDIKLAKLREFAPNQKVYPWLWTNIQNILAGDYPRVDSSFAARQIEYLDGKVDGIVLWDAPGVFSYADIPMLGAVRDHFFPARIAYQ